MAQTAAHLVDHVIPPVAMRQWVLSLPKRLRWYLLRDAPLICSRCGGPVRIVAFITEAVPIEQNRRVASCFAWIQGQTVLGLPVRRDEGSPDLRLVPSRSPAHRRTPRAPGPTPGQGPPDEFFADQTICLDEQINQDRYAFEPDQRLSW